MIKGVRVCLGTPLITHLFFANYSLIFFQVPNAENECLKHLLHLYETAFGQKNNLDKTKLISRNNEDQVVNDIKRLLNVTSLQHHDHFLGLPSFIGKSCKMKERVWKKFQGWKEKLLSQVGREILIKVVVQALPTYIMSCFKLPK